MTTVAIVVLTYNSLEQTTKPCVESVYRVKTEIDFELILVDNCSVDGTRDYLKGISGKYENIRIILNDKNLGYAAGNNVGIKSIEAEYYVLLNSDTIVTDYWLDGLVNFFEKYSDVGMVGPVSNSVGNEQVIHVDFINEEDVIEEGLCWASRCRGDFFYTEMLGFFCVAIRKEIIDSVGILDESFGLGMFEDDDYCLRVRLQGNRLACVEDVFVYHKGSISFSNAGIANLNELFYSNLKKFQDKHNVEWRTGCSAPPFLRLLQHYLSQSDSDPDKLRFKLSNKINVMNKLHYPTVNVNTNVLVSELASANEQLARIKASRIWKILTVLTALVDRVWTNTRR